MKHEKYKTHLFADSKTWARLKEEVKSQASHNFLVHLVHTFISIFSLHYFVFVEWWWVCL